MAGADLDLNIRINSADAMRAVNSMTSSLKALEFISEAAAAIWTGGKIVAGIKNVIAASAESEKSLNKMNTALFLSGDYSQQASKEMQQFAKQVQATTIYDDDLVLSQLALAKSFGLSNDKAKQLVLAATDLAAVTGEDLEGAMHRLQATLSGSAGRLGQLVPQVRLLTEEQLRAGAAIDLVGSRLHGAAQAMTGTFSGAIAQATNKFSDLKESIGDIVTKNPVVVTGIREMGRVFQAASEWVEQNKLQMIGLVKDGFVSLLSAIPAVLEGLHVFNAGMLAVAKTSSWIEQAWIGVKAAGVALSGQSKQVIDANMEDLAKEVQAIRKNSEEAGKNYDERTKLINEFIERIRAEVDVVKARVSAEKEATNSFLEGKKQEKAAIEAVLEAEKRRRIEANQRVAMEAATKNPFAAFSGSLYEGLNKKEGVTQGQVAAGGALAIINDAMKGAAGAATMFAQGLGYLADTILPGIGGVVGEIVQVLAQGPDKVREFVTGFLDAIPTIIENIAESLAQLPDIIANKFQDENFIRRLADAFVRAAFALTEKMPFVAARMAVELTAQMPHIAVTFATELVHQVPQIVGALIDEIRKGIGSIGGLFGGGGGGIFGAIGGAVSDAVSAVGDFLGFAGGGKVPGRSYAGDRVLIRANSGENVIDRSLSQKLENFLAKDSGGSDGGPITVVAKLVVGERELAETVLRLNRQGFRLA